LCSERSLELLVGMLGILKAGGAYLPIDPDTPEDRVAYLLADANVEVVLTQRELLQTLPVLADYSVLPLDAELRDVFLSECPTDDIDRRTIGLGARHLAYVIYTSGSTGQPKGVMVEHRSVLRLVVNNHFAPVQAGDCVAHCANPAFDA